MSVSASFLSSTSTGTPQGTESSGAASTGGSTVPSADNSGSSLSTGAEIGIGVGVVAAVIIIVAVFFTVRRSRAKGMKITRLFSKHPPEYEGNYDSRQHQPEIGELSNSQAVARWDDKPKIPELSNDSITFELGGARKPVELEGTMNC